MRLYDAVAEMQIIKTVCDTHDPIKRAKILTRVQADYFGDDNAKKIYDRILLLTQNAKDIPSTKVLSIDNTLDDASKALIANPGYQALDTFTDIESSIELLESYRKSRLLFDAINISLTDLKEPKPDTETIINRLSVTMQKCHSEADDDEIEHYNAANAKDICKEVVRDLNEKSAEDFIPTGRSEFDRRTGGLRRKNVLVVASVPGGGKSTLALQIASDQFTMGFNVCYVSIEMDKIEIRYRLLSATSQINHREINLKNLSKKQIKHINDEFYKFLTDTAGDKKNSLSIFCPRDEKSIGDIVRDIQHFKYDCIVIDYIGLLKDTSSKKQLWESLGEHAKQAKIAANKLNAAMIILAQYDDEGNKIKYSRAIEAHANFIWAWEHGDKEKESGIINVKQLKARSAEEYDFYLLKDFAVCSFRDHMGPPPTNEQEDKDKKKKFKKKKKEKIEDIKEEEEDNIENKRNIPKMPQLV